MCQGIVTDIFAATHEPADAALPAAEHTPGAVERWTTDQLPPHLQGDLSFARAHDAEDARMHGDLCGACEEEGNDHDD